MDFNENYVVVKINLTSVDNALDTLYSFNGLKTIAGGDIAALDLSAVFIESTAATSSSTLLTNYSMSWILTKTTMLLQST